MADQSAVVNETSKINRKPHLMSNFSRTCSIFQRKLKDVQPIVHFIPQKACLIGSHYICQDCWLNLYLIHDNFAPMMHPCLITFIEVYRWAPNTFTIFQTRLLERPQCSFISLALLFGYMRAYGNTFFWFYLQSYVKWSARSRSTSRTACLTSAFHNF